MIVLEVRVTHADAARRDRPPAATCRLQLNRDFTFEQVSGVVDYLDALGIRDVYLAPVLEARPGSSHGYDVVDHSRLNPELGADEELRRLLERLARSGMGAILDIVPNHMCVVGNRNAWWNDVLENGPSSRYARHFDIDWTPPKPDLAEKVLLPILGDQYGRVLENGEIRVVLLRGAFCARYFEHNLPLAPRSWLAILEPALRLASASLGDSDPARLELESIVTALSHLPLRSETDPERLRERQREKEHIKRRVAALIAGSRPVRGAVEAALEALNGRAGDPRSFDRLEAMLADQAFRLSHWRVATDEINYRRFFDVNDLAAVRVEDPVVFEAVHALAFRLLEEGTINGLRIDHVDGLLDPADYLARLPERAYVVVEKILGAGERLRGDWPVAGTTGYEFLNLLNGVFVEPASERPLLELYEGFTGTRRPFDDIVYECKKAILQTSMSAELMVLARKLDRLSEQHRFSRDFTLKSLLEGLAEVIASFPVYRTYVRASDTAPEPQDRANIEAAIQLAKRRNPSTSASLFDFVASVLLLEDPEGLDARQRAERRDFVLRLQQLTGPVMAKGVEDTAFYRFYPLASLNEVGGEPDRFGVSLEEFHAHNSERRARWPHALSASSTHDTKRDEDVRARINVLSEVPELWGEAVRRWRDLNASHRAELQDCEVPDANEEYLLYQTLVGAWPVRLQDEAGHARFVARIQDYMLKATREAKLHTSWINPNAAYEEAVRDFVAGALDRDSNQEFLEDLQAFVSALLVPGLLSSVSQTLLKVLAPGVPDFYQGTELWEFNLVDPDNRRPVDFEVRRTLLASVTDPTGSGPELADELLLALPDPRLKLLVTQRSLALRRRSPELLARGDYQALTVTGKRGRNVVAFARALADEAIVVAAGRFFNALPSPPTGAAWGGSTLRLGNNPAKGYRELLSERELEVHHGPEGPELPLALVFAHLPVALLERIT
jgi:(1->4)-alpha-D-glucan 1-alpha-D-glucosylmutase